LSAEIISHPNRHQGKQRQQKNCFQVVHTQVDDKYRGRIPKA
jgi:hypothetical protein